MSLSAIKYLMLLGMTVFVASADEITFSVSTTGAFSVGTPAELSFNGIGSLPPTGPAGFTGTTSGGTLTLSDLGTFRLIVPSHAADVYDDTFTLDVLFFLPIGIIGQQTTYSAALAGTVNSQQGWLDIDFGPTQHLTFSNLSASGSFDLTLNDLRLDIPHRGGSASANLTGEITNAAKASISLNGDITEAGDPTSAVPEPVSVVLLGTVTLFATSLLRRRQVSRN